MTSLIGMYDGLVVKRTVMIFDELINCFKYEIDLEAEVQRASEKKSVKSQLTVIK